MEPLLSVRDLTVTFGSFTAVDGVSFDLHEGQTWRSWASLVRASRSLRCRSCGSSSSVPGQD